MDYYVKSFKLSDGSIINCMIYDTGGQERYKAINETYYKKADAILLVYDISNISSFDEIKNYYVKRIRESCEKDIPILLLGNKADLEEKRQVTKEQGIELALKENYEFNESSCMKNLNVAGAFESLIERWNIENHKKEKNKKIDKKKSEKKLTRANTEIDLEIDTLKFNSESKRNTTYERTNIPFKNKTITLKAEHLKEKKKHKCCLSSKFKSNEI